MKSPLPLLSLLLGLASVPALFAADTPAVSSSPAQPQGQAPAAPKPPPDVHGVDMRTQSGPPGQRYSPPSPPDNGLPTFWLIGDSTVRNGSAGDGTNLFAASGCRRS